MGRRRAEPSNLSRRQFLKQFRYTPPLFLPAQLRWGCAPFAAAGLARLLGVEVMADPRLSPEYPSRSPLDEMLRLVAPGADGYGTEKSAAELQELFAKLRAKLRGGNLVGADLARMLDAGIEYNSPRSLQETAVSNHAALDVRRRSYSPETRVGADPAVAELLQYFSSLGRLETAEFDIVGLKRRDGAVPVELDAEVRYALVGSRADGRREERIGTWRMRWRQAAEPGTWTATRWIFTDETRAAAVPFFVDITAQSLGQTASYRQQLTRGVDHWRTVLDAASGIDVYGNNGVAAGDFDGDGRDDFYVCQPSGLPNRLYRNRGDGTFEDVTEKAGVGVLDATACAIFADFDNQGVQDLLVVTASGPLLFRNGGGGKFTLKADAFLFSTPPAGTFTHAAVADYDRDGRLDIYFCLYSYYLGLDQYHYPSPYFNARNGPPNFLLHNEGNRKFLDRTAAAGLNAENDRFSFACSWGDISGNGGPDLYVANDFGRSNLYRNNGNGTFAPVSQEAGANLPGAGMSACWCDFDNHGRQDIYVSNMWAAAGQRVSEDEKFHSQDSADIRSYYQAHARGNSLYRNRGGGKFENVAEGAGAAMGRWAWCSDAWDFDHDGYSDLYIANGYISGSEQPELSSFFWRQVVGNSPSTSTPSATYEHGWNAINELIRSDHSWNGYERNTLYLNNRNGTFSEISGVSGLDFIEDSRSFALADLDGDGRLEVVLKNRNAPQVRLLRNELTGIGDAVCFRLRGTKSNRDAIGAAVTLACNGLLQTKYLQAGSGFLAQHSKELFFGLGQASGKITVAIHWPSGLTESFADVPANRRVTIEEGAGKFSAVPFATRAVDANAPVAQPPLSQPEDTAVATWLLDPLPAPDFSLPDRSGQPRKLSAFRGKPLLLFFWAEASPLSVRQLESFQRGRSELAAKNVQIVCLNLDKNVDAAKARELLARAPLTFDSFLATSDVAGVYNIIYRYLFDRRRDLPIPCSFLLDESGLIVKIYQGPVEAKQLLTDAAAIPRAYESRLAKGLPFPGTLHHGRFARNDFTFGVALFQHGYLDQAAESFQQVIAAKPDDAEAYYNLGTLYLRKNDPDQARGYLQKAIELRPAYPEAWNNLGMIAGQQNQPDQAIRCFLQSLDLRPDYVTALLNLGNIYRRQGNAPEAERLLNRAVALEPQNAEANYGLGMLYARQGDLDRSVALLRKAIELRPEYPDAMNNLGVLYVRQGKNADAEAEFARCINLAPNFDQPYLNLARLYMLLQEKEKARETLQALLKLQPRHKLAEQALEMLN